MQGAFILYLLAHLLSSSTRVLPDEYSFIMEQDRNILSLDNTRQAVISAEHPLVVATRLHLGKATSPPADLEDKMNQFADFCYKVCTAAIAQIQPPERDVTPTAPLVVATVAVDATPLLDNYDLLQAVRQVSDQIMAAHDNGDVLWKIHVVAVQPWGRFVPALNALVVYAATKLKASRIMFVSAETTSVSVNAVARLLKETLPLAGGADNILVAGARLAGHDHQVTDPNKPQTVPLNGRTTPWNTLAVWHLPKLAMTGFQLISDGLVSDLVPATDKSGKPLINMGGVEETVTIALIQKLLGPKQALAKLLAVPEVTWNEKFEDPARQEWHDQKMASKMGRAQQQIDLLGLTDGQVQHLVA